jgi:tetratricopeptide (TPR) repeat protein
MILGQQNELASAREHLIRAIQIHGNTPSAAHFHYLLAQILTEQNELEKALEELSTATSLRPNYAEAFLAQGFIRKQQLNNAAAIAAFKTAVALSPQDFEAQHELGAAYLRVGDASHAVVHLRQAAKLKPGDRSTLYQLCRALQKAGKAEEANACEQELSAKIRTGLATAANELTATQANNAGVELEKAGNLAGALEKYRAAVRLNPTQTVFRRNVALALCRLGRWDEGIAELREVVKENPDDAEATKALYIALENAREHER